MHKSFQLLSASFLVLLLTACDGRIPQAVESFSTRFPRPFGYVVGDEIKQIIDVEVRSGFELDAGSLPTAGQLNRWLDLKSVAVENSHHDRLSRYRISLNYQVFYAPLEVKMLAIPGFNLEFRQGVNSVQQAVPQWHFTVMPLRELVIRKQNGQEYLRDDLILSVEQEWAKFWVSFLALAMLLFYIAFLHGWLPRFQRRGIFSRALKLMNQTPPSDLSSMFKVMHSALNELNRQTLFSGHLDLFFQQYPHFKALSEQFVWFFNCSEQLHFGNENVDEAESILRLKRFCQDCRFIERTAL